MKTITVAIAIAALAAFVVPAHAACSIVLPVVNTTKVYIGFDPSTSFSYAAVTGNNSNTGANKTTKITFKPKSNVKEPTGGTWGVVTGTINVILAADTSASTCATIANLTSWPKKSDTTYANVSAAFKSVTIGNASISITAFNATAETKQGKFSIAITASSFATEVTTSFKVSTPGSKGGLKPDLTKTTFPLGDVTFGGVYSIKKGKDTFNGTFPGASAYPLNGPLLSLTAGKISPLTLQLKTDKSKKPTISLNTNFKLQFPASKLTFGSLKEYSAKITLKALGKKKDVSSPVQFFATAPFTTA